MLYSFADTCNYDFKIFTHMSYSYNVSMYVNVPEKIRPKIINNKIRTFEAQIWFKKKKNSSLNPIKCVLIKNACSKINLLTL